MVVVTGSAVHVAAETADSVLSQLPAAGGGGGCGRRTQPWLLEAPAGQRINVSLLDFTPRSPSHTTSSSSSSSGRPSCGPHQYGYVVDKSARNNVSICASQHRQQHIYTSAANSLQLYLPTLEEQSRTSVQVASKFLIRVEGSHYFDCYNTFFKNRACHSRLARYFLLSRY